MDGYSVRGDDMAEGVSLAVIGESAAGRAFEGGVGPGQAVRIFTGAPMPAGADTILIQEDAAGVDFHEGDVLLVTGRVLDSAALGLAAAMGHPALPVRRKPRVAILATGDELVAPGEPVGRDQIVASNSFSLAALVEKAGGEPIDLGIARDSPDDLQRAIGWAQAANAELLITLGGASVGDHDLVQQALT